MIEKVWRSTACEGCGYHAARSALNQPPQLECGGMDHGKTYHAPTAELDVVDRVGGGDGFAAGFIYGLLTGEPPDKPSGSAGRMARC